MRDIVVTEYGIADLRGKSDADTIVALLEIADSRFQQDLANKARAAGKLPASYRLPDSARNNTPQTLKKWLEPHRDRSLPQFPFGTDFTDIEQYLLPALADLRRASSRIPALLALMLRGVPGRPARHEHEALDRMALTHPDGIKARAAQLALRGALRKQEDAEDSD